MVFNKEATVTSVLLKQFTKETDSWEGHHPRVEINTITNTNTFSNSCQNGCCERVFMEATESPAAHQPAQFVALKTQKVKEKWTPVGGQSPRPGFEAGAPPTHLPAQSCFDPVYIASNNSLKNGK